MAVEIATGHFHTFHAKSVLIATGGFGRMFKVSSNAYALTRRRPGDRLVDLAAILLEDLGVCQFPRAGKPIAWVSLLSEALSGRRRCAPTVPNEDKGEPLRA